VRKGKHIVTSKTEHKAVLDTCRQLEREGFEVTYLDPMENGLIDLEVLKGALRDDTTVVSIMHVNNEIGVIQDIAAIGEICRERKIIFHVDAAHMCVVSHVFVSKHKYTVVDTSAVCDQAP